MVKRLDEALGRLQDALKSLALTDKTIICFTSDHGCHFKTRNAEYKRSGHESSIRVPTAFCGPGFEGGGQVQELVSLIDLPPTLLEAAHLPVPPEMAGRSIFPLLKGARGGWPEEVFVQVSEAQVGRVVRTQRWKYGVTAPEKDPIRDPASELYVEEFLYDLQADPYELANLIGLESHGEVSQVMRERLLRRMRQAGEAPAEIRPLPSQPTSQRRVSATEAQS
jgi:arylsulfatase A-like enzyme